MSVSLSRPVPLSKLDAVNLVLRARGQGPTTVLGAGARGAANAAEETLATESLMVQSMEWGFNTEEQMELIPNTSKEIYTPENLLSFETVGQSRGLQVAERGGRLYDRSSSTFKFEKPVMVRATLALPFDELPQPARWYIALRASGENANQVFPADGSLRATARQIEEAQALLQSYDNNLGNSRKNLRTSNPHFNRLRGRR